MSRNAADTVEAGTRLATHTADAVAHPLSSAEVARWVLSLSGFDDFDGKVDALAACEDMLAHASEDDMLAADRTIIVAAIARLHKELDATPDHLRVRRRIDYCRAVAALSLFEGDDPLSD